jgi:hypothetical protein
MRTLSAEDIHSKTQSLPLGIIIQRFARQLRPINEHNSCQRARRLAAASYRVARSSSPIHSQMSGLSSNNIAARIAPGSASTALTPYRRQTLRMAWSLSSWALSMVRRSRQNSSDSPTVRGWRARASMLARFTDDQAWPLRNKMCKRHADWLKANRPNVLNFERRT